MFNMLGRMPMQDQKKIDLSTRRPEGSKSFRAADALRFRRKILVAGRPLLIVEDEYLIAADLASQIADDGGAVLGPALSMSEARELLRQTDDIGGAILDVKLDNADTFDLADALAAEGVPFVFYTGYRSLEIPDRFIAMPRIVKPAGWRQVKQGLAIAMERLNHTGRGSFRRSIEAALPMLRRKAKRLVANPEDADRLVEATLERAITSVASRSLQMTIEEWLTSLLVDTTPEARKRLFH